jgi:hypothetical protein
VIFRSIVGTILGGRSRQVTIQAFVQDGTKGECHQKRKTSDLKRGTLNYAQVSMYGNKSGEDEVRCTH